jgi:hypothetical protein
MKKKIMLAHVPAGQRAWRRPRPLECVLYMGLLYMSRAPMKL